MTKFLGFGPRFFGPCNSRSRSLKRKANITVKVYEQIKRGESSSKKKEKVAANDTNQKGEDSDESCGCVKVEQRHQEIAPSHV